MAVSEAWEHQRRTFERTAEAYDRNRPSYPDALFEDLRTYADLSPGDRILEIGSGPGKATVALAAWGHGTLCLEPAPEMVEVARRNLAAFPNVTFETHTFEQWSLEPSAFGLVAVAQAFHWLDPETRAGRIAAALRRGGTAALLWNAQVTPDEHRALFVRVQDVYLEHAPALAHKGEFRAEPGKGHVLDGADGFVDLERRDHPWEWTLRTDEYVALMATHSPHAALPDEVRTGLLNGIAQVIDDEFGGRVTESYFAELHLARRA